MRAKTNNKPQTRSKTTATDATSKVQRNTFVTLGIMFVFLFIWFLLWLYDWVKDNFPKSSIFGAINASTASNDGVADKPAVVNNYVTHENVTNEYNNTNIGGGRYIHKELTPKTVWTINHNLGTEPTLDVYSTENEILAFATREDIHEERFTTDDPPVAYDFYYRTVLTFSTPQTGYAFLTI